MNRTALALFAEDISSFARSLSAQLANCDHQPSHLELLNMLARSSGCRNFLHYRALRAPIKPEPEALAAQLVDMSKIKRLARYFDAKERLIRWPGKYSQREPCLWVLWSKLPPRQELDELEMNRLLRTLHVFEDHALLRRMLFDYGLVSRTPDGRVYRRIEREPTAEALALVRCLGERQAV